MCIRVFVLVLFCVYIPIMHSSQLHDADIIDSSNMSVSDVELPDMSSKHAVVLLTTSSMSTRVSPSSPLSPSYQKETSMTRPSIKWADTSTMTFQIALATLVSIVCSVLNGWLHAATTPIAGLYVFPAPATAFAPTQGDRINVLLWWELCSMPLTYVGWLCLVMIFFGQDWRAWNSNLWRHMGASVVCNVLLHVAGFGGALTEAVATVCEQLIAVFWVSPTIAWFSREACLPLHLSAQERTTWGAHLWAAWVVLRLLWLGLLVGVLFLWVVIPGFMALSPTLQPFFVSLFLPALMFLVSVVARRLQHRFVASKEGVIWPFYGVLQMIMYMTSRSLVFAMGTEANWGTTAFLSLLQIGTRLLLAKFDEVALCITACGEEAFHPGQRAARLWTDNMIFEMMIKLNSIGAVGCDVFWVHYRVLGDQSAGVLANAAVQLAFELFSVFASIALEMRYAELPMKGVWNAHWFAFAVTSNVVVLTGQCIFASTIYPLLAEAFYKQAYG
jgi:hypothetical protein